MADSSVAQEEAEIGDFGDEPREENCIGRALGAGIGAAAMGGFIGTVSGALQRAGFKKAFAEGGSSAKTFAIISGVHSLVSCSLKKIRQKDDAINAGVAGCASGMALTLGSPPIAILQNCVGFAAFSFIIEYFSTPPPAEAKCEKGKRKQQRGQKGFPGHLSLSVLPPFSLALPMPTNKLFPRS